MGERKRNSGRHQPRPVRSGLCRDSCRYSVLKKNSVEFVPELPEEQNARRSTRRLELMDKTYCDSAASWAGKADWLPAGLCRRTQRVAGPSTSTCPGLSDQPILLGFNVAPIHGNWNTKTDGETVADMLAAAPLNVSAAACKPTQRPSRATGPPIRSVMATSLHEDRLDAAGLR